ncbi:hypothetical protein Hypma_003124 [Hypsizygus marmoreus]|uniref:Uncharacterized protein n=1 Tax=Hypsizygus marmoreus TaxID=39966 RepID=A0A369J9S7_HYPMA|nr:hypothetical protein Hypma_003124 [Hypsizygus marmoreus]
MRCLYMSFSRSIYAPSAFPHLAIHPTHLTVYPVHLFAAQQSSSSPGKYAGVWDPKGPRRIQLVMAGWNELDLQRILSVVFTDPFTPLPPLRNPCLSHPRPAYHLVRVVVIRGLEKRTKTSRRLSSFSGPLSPSRHYAPPVTFYECSPVLLLGMERGVGKDQPTWALVLVSICT